MSNIGMLTVKRKCFLSTPYSHINNIDKYEIEDPFFMQWIINKDL